MNKFSTIIIYILLSLSSIDAQNFKQIFPIANDPTISEIDPYLTYFWYGGWINYGLNKTNTPNTIRPIWLTYIETDLENFSNVIAYNMQYDSEYKLILSKKYTILESSDNTFNRNPIIENCLGKPVAIWKNTDNGQTDLYFSIFNDSIWDSPQNITNDTLVESNYLFFTIGAWSLEEQDTNSNYLFWISNNTIYSSSLLPDYKWDTITTHYSSESNIDNLKLRKSMSGDTFLLFNEQTENDSINFKILVQSKNKVDWVGPLNLFKVHSSNQQTAINIYEDWNDQNKILLSYIKNNSLVDTVFYYKNDSLKFESNQYGDNYFIEDSIHFVSNTLLSGGCIISPWPYFFIARYTNNKKILVIKEGYYYQDYFNILYYETENIINGLTISGLDETNFFTAWSEFDGNQSDIYFYSDYLIIGDVETNEIINDFKLSQNYPNPFNPTTRIEYTIPYVVSGFSLRNVSLKVYDVLGRKITTLVNERQSPGTYKVEFDASELANGIYFYRLTLNNLIETKKMVVLK